MGLTKAEKFTTEQNRIAALTKALAHPARIAILQYLLKINTCVCGDLVEETGLAQATTSQHLKELKKVGLIKGTVEGVRVCYCIDPVVWKDAETILAQFFANLQIDQSCC